MNNNFENSLSIKVKILKVSGKKKILKKILLIKRLAFGHKTHQNHFFFSLFSSFLFPLLLQFCVYNIKVKVLCD